VLNHKKYSKKIDTSKLENIKTQVSWDKNVINIGSMFANNKVKFEYTFGYIKDKNENLLINLHYSLILFSNKLFN